MLIPCCHGRHRRRLRSIVVVSRKFPGPAVESTTRVTNVLLSLFEIIYHFNFFKYIAFTMQLDIYYIYLDIKYKPYI
jgi:hypothetical protein